jgi:hypothetical protein
MIAKLRSVAAERRPTTDGGVEILAKGRSAIALLVWLDGIVGVERVTGSPG